MSGTGFARRFVAAHPGTGSVARVIYGAIIGLALVVALEHHPPDPLPTAVTIFGASLAVGLAELYSEWIGRGAREGHDLTPDERRELYVETVAVTCGAGFPAVFFVLAAVGLLEQASAFTLAKWTGLGLICVYGFAGARLAGASVARALLDASVVGAIAAALIALKAFVH
jgi:VIT1/CCC1 family predicted Fe2+/Mn2+ transporter